MASTLVVSLDLELFWGLHDLGAPEQIGPRLDGVRRAVDGMCAAFEAHEIHATWAVVGFAMASGVDELRAWLPDVWPAYREPRRSPYRWLDRIGALPSAWFFGPDLVERVVATPHQEIGSHTFSHFTCLEEGATEAAFRADLRAARHAASRSGLAPTSLVFPRNQLVDTYVQVAYEEGFRNVRGLPEVPMYRPRPHGASSWWRALRLVDSHLPVTRARLLTFADPLDEGAAIDVPASRFLRPVPRAGWRRALQTRRVLAELRAAVAEGRHYHLWWHPHNFAERTDAALAELDDILRHVGYLRDRYGLQSRSMAEVGAEVARAA